MDEHQGPSPCEDSFAEKTAGLLEKLRAESAGLRTKEEARWSELESRLHENLRTIEAEIVRHEEATVADRAAADTKADQFTRDQDHVRDEQRELAEYLQEIQDRLALQEEELAKREKLIAQTEQAQQDTENLLNADRAELDRAHGRFHERASSLDRQSERLESDRQRLKDQRQAVGEKLREHRQTQQAALDRERAALHDRLAALDIRLTEVTGREEDLDRQKSEIAEQIDSLGAEDANGSLSDVIRRLQDDLEARNARIAQLEQLLTDRNSDLKALRDVNSHIEKDLESAAHTRDTLAESLAESEGKLSEANEQLAAQPDTSELQTKFDLAVEEARDLRAQNAELEEQLSSLGNSDSHDSNELADLRNERDALLEQVEELQSQSSTGRDDSQQQELDDLRQRFEMAVDDVRRLKTENEELERKLTDRDKLDHSGGQTTDGLDWEAMKTRLMASLDEDFDTNDEEDRQERTTIEGTIRITDDIVEEKDKEILDLKRLLENQTESIGEVAVGAGAVAELFDQDESIRQERERLAELQSEWENKLRQSELELSVQRAKFARDRAELDKKQQALDELNDEIKAAADAIPRTDSRKRQRRWLSRLGLNKEDEE